MSLCVIPARGQSKRIPRKNIRSFCGRPMIAWPIAAALDAECFDRIVVSTDDEEIAHVAKAAGAEVPFLRPADLSDDFTPTRPVIAHAVEALQYDGPVCCLYATSPFAQGRDLQEALALHASCGATYVLSVVRQGFPIERMLRMSNDNALSMISPEHALTRSQDLPDAWHDAGQFYVATAQQWCQDTPIFSAGAMGLPLPRNRVQDIDTQEDWDMAEAMFKAQGLDR